MSLTRSNIEQSPREMFPVYSEGPARATDPFAVTDGKFKAHFFTKGSGASFGGVFSPVLFSFLCFTWTFRDNLLVVYLLELIYWRLSRPPFYSLENHDHDRRYPPQICLTPATTTRCVLSATLSRATTRRCSSTYSRTPGSVTTLQTTLCTSE